MASFMFLYRGGAPQAEGLSPKQMEDHMMLWDAWVEELTSKGALRGAEALAPGGRTVGPQGVVVDGPFAESKEVVGGYSLIEAGDIEEACELAKGCPIYQFQGHVEVRPIVEMCLDPSE